MDKTSEILVGDQKTKIDKVIEKLFIQPVGNGYIDCICSMQIVGAFIDAMNELM